MLNTMKITEISVGNYLQNTNGNIGRVIGITEQGEVIMRYNENSTTFSELGVLKPIDLTPEILIRNGWVYDSIYSRKADELGRVAEYYHFEGSIRLYWDNFCYAQSAAGMVGVHLLQNFLTLNGIGVDIKL